MSVQSMLQWDDMPKKEDIPIVDSTVKAGLKLRPAGRPHVKHCFCQPAPSKLTEVCCFCGVENTRPKPEQPSMVAKKRGKGDSEEND